MPVPPACLLWAWQEDDDLVGGVVAVGAASAAVLAVGTSIAAVNPLARVRTSPQGLSSLTQGKPCKCPANGNCLMAHQHAWALVIDNTEQYICKFIRLVRVRL